MPSLKLFKRKDDGPKAREKELEKKGHLLHSKEHLKQEKHTHANLVSPVPISRTLKSPPPASPVSSRSSKNHDMPNGIGHSPRRAFLFMLNSVPKSSLVLYPQEPTPRPVRAATINHHKPNAFMDHPRPLPLIDTVPQPRKPLSVHTHQSTTSSFSSRITSDGLAHNLPLPLGRPEHFLPPRLRHRKSDLYDEFVIPELSSNKNKRLGAGASAAVRTVVTKDVHKKVYALKKFTLFRREDPLDFYKRCSKEYVIARALSACPHIVSTYSLVVVPTIAEMTRGWGFVMEYCSGGDLFSLIQKLGWKLASNNEKFCVFKQIALAVKFMHDCGIAHRDLKPENVLMSAQGCAKLTDFGVATVARDENGEVKMSSAFVGSPPYSSPEVMELREHKGRSYDPFKMDMWSLGMLLFCMVYQGTPFQEACTLDSMYRDYITAYAQFTQRFPAFRTEGNHSMKGPGVEYKYGQMFKDGDASRVAWRLCDPKVSTRYTLTNLFEDQWFTKLEMCKQEGDFEVLVDRLRKEDCTADVLLAEWEHMKDGFKLEEEAVEEPVIDNHMKSMLDVFGDKPKNGEKTANCGAEHANDVIKESTEEFDNGEPVDEAEKESAEKPIIVPIKETTKEPESELVKYASKESVNKTGQTESDKDCSEEHLPHKPEIEEIEEKLLPGSVAFLANLPDDRYCKGPIHKHHHNEVSDITLNALGSRPTKNFTMRAASSTVPAKGHK